MSSICVNSLCSMPSSSLVRPINRFTAVFLKSRKIIQRWSRGHQLTGSSVCIPGRDKGRKIPTNLKVSLSEESWKQFTKTIDLLKLMILEMFDMNLNKIVTHLKSESNSTDNMIMIFQLQICRNCMESYLDVNKLRCDMWGKGNQSNHPGLSRASIWPRNTQHLRHVFSAPLQHEWQND